MKKNIVFLDIDGVLNSEIWYEKIHDKETKTHAERNIDPDAVKLVNRLCKEINADVVVSSTWRMGISIEELQEMLDSRGADFKIVGKTIVTELGIRGAEIFDWWRGNCEKYNNYVILDDDNDMLIHQAPHFFQTDVYVGITYTIVNNVVDYILDRKLIYK